MLSLLLSMLSIIGLQTVREVLLKQEAYSLEQIVSLLSHINMDPNLNKVT
jgi:hypothetical protein